MTIFRILLLSKVLAGIVNHCLHAIGLTRKSLQGLKEFEVVTKLGFAMLPNSTQSMNTAFVTGILNTARGIMDSTQKNGTEFALKTGATLQTTVNDAIRRATSSTGSPPLLVLARSSAPLGALTRPGRRTLLRLQVRRE